MITNEREPEYETITLRDLFVQFSSGESLDLTLEAEDSLVIDEDLWDMTITTTGKVGELKVNGKLVEYYKIAERLHRRLKK